ncbi:MAG: DUF1553 domain-containing protein [Verrucomicrobiaceae bacterium]|nr:DUF1553 domain-containing protein [Verrucomicrobiaceae bacterium]
MKITALIALAFGTSVIAAPAPSFRNQVQPILAKFGCSTGACHGAAAGQGGFKLSLLGYDHIGDQLAIARAANGRRIVVEDPARSLLLLKATKTVPHKGGEKIKTGSREYQILADWIAGGAPGPQTSDPNIQRIEITPSHATLKPGAALPLKVTAFFDNGASEDVTRWVKYTAGNNAVATVDDVGNVKVSGQGEGTITAWYLSRLSIATITVPFEQQVKADIFAAFKPRNFIDERVIEKLRELNIPPSAACTDDEFIRRAFLDTLGVLPSAEEVRAFLADTSSTKRDALIDSLLKRPEFTDYWSYKWSDLLLVNSDKLAVRPMWSYYQWIRRNVEQNTPWDVLVRNLLTATGSTLENGASNFFTLHDEPTKLAETTSVAFLGMSIACAKCHNHPMEKWTNDQYFAFANLFSRVRAKTTGLKDEQVVFSATTGDIVQPLTGKPQAPAPLDAQSISMTSTQDRRITAAEWVTSPTNPYFARSITNRVWANFFGSGLVNAVDDLRMTNPASNEKLLHDAAQHLITHKFDLKALMRAILQSQTYQRSSVALAENKADTRFYSHYYPKRLMAEVLLDAISQVTAAPTSFNMERRNANRGLGEAYPMGFRALQVPDSNTRSYFLNAFGRPDRVQTCECERTNEPSMAQALHIANGDTLNQKLVQKNNRLDQLLASGKSPAEIVDEVYLCALSRFPTAKEKAEVTKLLTSAKPEDKRQTLEDIFWGVMSARDFVFNH